MILNYISGARCGVKTARFIFQGNDFIGFTSPQRRGSFTRHKNDSTQCPLFGIKRACAFFTDFFTSPGLLAAVNSADKTKKTADETITVVADGTRQRATRDISRSIPRPPR
jgi:hypothetical protein